MGESGLNIPASKNSWNERNKLNCLEGGHGASNGHPFLFPAKPRSIDLVMVLFQVVKGCKKWDQVESRHFDGFLFQKLDFLI